MTDYGTRHTDLAVKRAEWRLSRVYHQAAQDIDDKLKDWEKRHAAREAKYRQQVKEGKLSQADFDAWMRGQVFQGEQWRARKAEIDQILLNADRAAASIVNDGKLGVFAANANYVGYGLEHDANINTGFTLYDEQTVARLIKSDPQILPKPAPGVKKDKAYTYYNKLMNSAITQGIVQGETIPQIAKRIARTTGESSYKSAVRNARTAYTGAQNAGRIEGLHQAQRLGIKVQKKWMATLDDRTRDAHADLDGQVRDVDEPFDSELGPIDFPGDPTAEPGNVYNCFVGETNVATDSDIIRSYKHDYSGELITVKAACGVEFTCTPNHPILTPRGWVAAKRLNNGDDLLIASIGEVYALRVNPNVDHAPSRIDAIHSFFEVTGCKRTTRLGVNFHGDVPASDVEIITQKRFLRNNRDSGSADSVDKFLLKHSDESLMGKGAFVQHFGSVRLTALRFMRSFGKAFAFFWSSLTHAVIHRFGTIARSYTAVFEPQSDSMTGDMQFFGDGLDGLPGKVFVDNIVNINITTVSHIPVYNLQTGNSRYFVNSIIAQNGGKCNGNFAIAHNCRCTLVYVYPDYPSDMQRRDNETGEIVGDMTYREWEEMKSKQQPEAKPEVNETQQAPEIRESLIDAYNYHSEHNGLKRNSAEDSIAFSERMGNQSQFDADLSRLDETGRENIARSVSGLCSDYDSPLSTIREMTPEEALGNRAFAATRHNYETDTAEILINPIKCRDTQQMVERLGELRDKGYLPKGIRDDQLGDYIITHEFGHSLINMQQPLDNKRNWVNADYGKIRSARREIEIIYAEYAQEVGRLDTARKAAEMDFMLNPTEEAAKRAQDLQRQVDAVRVSGYSMTNADEFIAESFAAVRFGATESPYARRCADVLDRYFRR